jgi:osmotically-inducible protein OsmY
MTRLTLAGGVLAACVAVGCSDQTQQQAREAGQEVAEAAKAAGNAVESAAQDAVNNVERASDSVQQASGRTSEAEAAVKQTGQTARETVNQAADAAAAAVQTAQVKSALVADSSVDAKDINVDTDAATKTIILKGHVPSAAQKTAAERIAKAKASTSYTVRNELLIK